MTWFNWELVEKENRLLCFWKQLIVFRQQHATIHRSRFFTGKLNESGIKDISWHGVQLDTPGWDDPNGRTLAFTLGGIDKDADIHVMINMYWEELEFEIPTLQGKKWYQVIDTYQPSPKDITLPSKESLIEENSYLVQERSVVVLISQ
ncbi:glycogen debranching enzyme GlgX [Beggiatoa sp. PS]|nr:glycogen debranching enzyme GlgX [Beggiatoa sp. PS]